MFVHGQRFQIIQLAKPSQTAPSHQYRLAPQRLGLYAAIWGERQELERLFRFILDNQEPPIRELHYPRGFVDPLQFPEFIETGKRLRLATLMGAKCRHAQQKQQNRGQYPSSCAGSSLRNRLHVQQCQI